MAESLLDTTYSLFKTLEDNDSGRARWVRCSATLRTCASDIVTESDISSKFNSIALESKSEGHENFVTFDQFLNAHLFLTGVNVESNSVFEFIQQAIRNNEECATLQHELFEKAERVIQLEQECTHAKDEIQRLQDDMYARSRDFQNVMEQARQREDGGVRSVGDESMFDIGNSIFDGSLLNDMANRDNARHQQQGGDQNDVGNFSIDSTSMSPFKIALATNWKQGGASQSGKLETIARLQDELAQAQAANASHESSALATGGEDNAADLHAQLTHAMMSNDALTETNAELRKETQRLQQDLDATSKQLSALLASPSTSFEQSPSRVGSDETNAAWGTIKSSATGGGIFKKKLDRAKLKIAELEERLQQRDEDLGRALSEGKKSTAELTKQKLEAEEASEILADDVRSLRQDLKDLKEEVATSQKIIERYKNTIRERDAELLDKEACEEEVRRLTKEVSVWQRRAHSHADQSHSMAEELNETTTGLHTASVDLSKLESEVSQAYTDADELRTKLQTTETELSSSQMQTVYTEQELENTLKTCAQLQQKEVAIREAFQQQKSELAAVREQLIQKSVQAAALQGDVVAKATTLNAERITVASLQAELGQKTAVIDGLSKYLEEMETQQETQEAKRDSTLDETTRSVLTQLNDELTAARNTIAELQQTATIASAAPSERSQGQSLPVTPAMTPHSMRGDVTDEFNDTDSYALHNTYMRMAQGGSDEAAAVASAGPSGRTSHEAHHPVALDGSERDTRLGAGDAHAHMPLYPPTAHAYPHGPYDGHADPRQWEYDAAHHARAHPTHDDRAPRSDDDGSDGAEAYLAKEREATARIIAELQAQSARDAEAADALAADNADLADKVETLQDYIRTQNKELAVFKAEHASAARDGNTAAVRRAYGLGGTGVGGDRYGDPHASASLGRIAAQAYTNANTIYRRANDVYASANDVYNTAVLASRSQAPGHPPAAAPIHGRVVASELYAHEHANTEHSQQQRKKKGSKTAVRSVGKREVHSNGGERTGIPGVTNTTAATMQKLGSLGGQHIGFWPVEVLTATEDAPGEKLGGLKCYASVSTSGVALLSIRDMHVIAEWPFSTISTFGREKGVVSIEIIDPKLHQRTFFFGTVLIAASELFDALQYGNDLN